jgi:hypothetical protein
MNANVGSRTGLMVSSIMESEDTAVCVTIHECPDPFYTVRSTGG